MSTSFPFLQDWIDKASLGHPLRDYFDLANGNGGTDSGASAIVTHPFWNEVAGPERPDARSQLRHALGNEDGEGQEAA